METCGVSVHGVAFRLRGSESTSTKPLGVTVLLTVVLVGLLATILVELFPKHTASLKRVVATEFQGRKALGVGECMLNSVGHVCRFLQAGDMARLPVLRHRGAPALGRGGCRGA